MASNTQIVANIHRRKAPGKRIWIGIVAAIVLVTLPVLPLKFLGIPGPDLDWHAFEELSRSLLGRMTTTTHAKRPAAEISAPAVTGSDIKLMDATIKSLLSQVSKNPTDPSLHNRLGLIYAEVGEPHSAVTHFEASIANSRERIKALTLQSNQASAQGNLDKASNCMLEISTLNVQLAAAHSSLARVYEQLGKSDRVMAQLAELSKDISLSGAMKQQSEQTTATAGTALSANRLDSETAVQLARADAFRQAGRNLEAMQEYKRLSERVPNLAIAHKELGMTALTMRNLWLAQEELTKAASLNSADATTHSALGNIFCQIGERDKAIKEYESALTCNPKEVTASFNLGNIYADSGQYEKAIVCFKKTVAGRPDFALAHNNLATMYSFRGDNAGAEREFRQAISLDGNMASAHYGLGIACLNTKNYNESARAFKRALALNPDLIDASSKLELAQKRARGQLSLN